VYAMVAGSIYLGTELRKDLRRVFSLDSTTSSRPLSAQSRSSGDGDLKMPIVRGGNVPHTYSAGRSFYTIGNPVFQKRLDKPTPAIAVSHSTTIALNRYFEANWTIVPNGIDTDVIQPARSRPGALRGMFPVILFLGRFDPRNRLTTSSIIQESPRENRPAQLVVVADARCASTTTARWWRPTSHSRLSPP